MSDLTLFNQGTGTDQLDADVHLHYEPEGDSPARVIFEVDIDLGIAGDNLQFDVDADDLRAVLPLSGLPFIPGELVMHPMFWAIVDGERRNTVIRIIELDDDRALVHIPGEGQTRLPLGELVRPRTMVSES